MSLDIHLLTAADRVTIRRHLVQTRFVEPLAVHLMPRISSPQDVQRTPKSTCTTGIHLARQGVRLRIRHVYPRALIGTSQSTPRQRRRLERRPLSWLRLRTSQRRDRAAALAAVLEEDDMAVEFNVVDWVDMGAGVCGGG